MVSEVALVGVFREWVFLIYFVSIKIKSEEMEMDLL